MPPKDSTPVPFSATTRLSGLDAGGDSWRKGAVDAISRLVGLTPAEVPAEVTAAVDRIARSGGTPLAVRRERRAGRRHPPEGRGQGRA